MVPRNAEVRILYRRGGEVRYNGLGLHMRKQLFPPMKAESGDRTVRGQGLCWFSEKKGCFLPKSDQTCFEDLANFLLFVCLFFKCLLLSNHHIYQKVMKKDLFERNCDWRAYFGLYLFRGNIVAPNLLRGWNLIQNCRKLCLWGVFGARLSSV